MMPDVFIHPTADVEEPYGIGEGTKVWRWTHISKGVKIGMRCVIGQGCYIGPNVQIGNDCHIQNGAFIPELVTIGNGVFIGPQVVFTNDKYPPSPRETWGETKVGDDASIGANSTIIAGVIIGRDARIGAGSVITKNIPDYGFVYGNPAA